MAIMHSIFVYGTLKRGYPNHDQYLKDQLYLGMYRTVDCYPLVIAKKWFSPVLINEPGSGKQIIGELYQVDNDRLLDLYTLEGTNFAKGYKRVDVSVQNIESHVTTHAFTYMKRRAHVAEISSDYLSEYTDRRYIPKVMRKIPGKS